MRFMCLVALVLLVAACDDSELGATATPTRPAPVAIEHPRGPTDVVLRCEFSGGFVLPAILATQAPIFTLYGDGTVIVRNPNQGPGPLFGSVEFVRPFRNAILSEDQIQKVLADALGRGGLRAARTDYSDNQIMDLPTAVFTINAGGINKRVSITGLGIDIGSTPDDVALAAFVDLAARLEDFANGDFKDEFSTGSWAPSRFRGSLLEGQAGVADAQPWPWTTIKPADFVVDADPNGFPLPARMMSWEDIGALELTFVFEGGFRNLTLLGPGDGKVYSLSLRPLLPDESK